MSDFFDQFENDSDNSNSEPVAELTVAKKKKPSEPQAEGQLTVDVYQTEKDIVIRSTVAGVTAQDIDISVTNDKVTIKGSRKPNEKVSPSSYHHQELFWGPFSRSIILPEEVDADNAAASMKNGILTLRLPKLSQSKIKKVKISS